MIKRNIPNALTCGNLLCGCFAIVSAFHGNLVWSGYLVLIAAVLDFFDGFIARLLKVTSPIGKELDSLADVVTFGVVPGVVMFMMIGQAALFSQALLLDIPDTAAFSSPTPILSYVAFLVTLFSAIRLAKFNVDTRQSDSFIGLPTPANAILICSLPLVIEQLTPSKIDISMAISAAFSLVNNPVPKELYLLTILLNPYFLIGLTVLSSYLLVSPIRLIALKFKNYSWADNKLQYVFLIISLFLLIVFQLVALPFIIILYIVISIMNNIFNKEIHNA